MGNVVLHNNGNTTRITMIFDDGVSKERTVNCIRDILPAVDDMIKEIEKRREENE